MKKIKSLKTYGATCKCGRYNVNFFEKIFVFAHENIEGFHLYLFPFDFPFNYITD